MQRAPATRLVLGTAQQVLGRAASATATFVALALAARALSPESFAALGAYLALWAILDVAIDGGSMSASLRAFSADPRVGASAIRRAHALRAALLLPSLAVVLWIALHDEPSFTPFALIASASLGAHLLAPATLPLHRELRFRAIAGARGAGAWLVALLVAFLYSRGDSAPGSYLCAFGVGAVASATIAWCAAPRVSSEERIELPLGPWLAEAAALGAAALARTAYFWIDALLVRWLAPESEAGGYHAAYRLFNVALLVATYASASALPLFAARGGAPSAELVRVGRGLALFGALLALGVALGSSTLLALAFGDAYLVAAPALCALAPAIAAIHVSAWLLTRLTAAKRSRAIAGISFAALALNLLLVLWWIPLYGALGAAAATSATELAVLALAFAAVRKGGRR
ncbi:MAG: polysaccharide biosynthesis C-terminal domain-containing protein [Planctomycetes bacterium]|nr:polysaccharide biosynthesis C-terminal domain-containing protein [Planctomycetota bacterium]